MRTQWTIKGWHVFAGLSVFFGVMLIANVIFITLAIKTHPGEHVENAYVAGLNFNEEIETQRSQRALGWQVAAAEQVLKNGEREVDLSFSDKAGRPLPGLALEAVLQHPTRSQLDQSLDFVDAGAGRYSARISDTRDIRWNLLVTARSRRDETFVFRYAM